MRLVSLILPFTFLCLVRADYECLCNYNEAINVYSAASENSNYVATLYEFDCKPTDTAPEENGFKRIQTDNQIGYVKTNDQTQVQICSGDPSPFDIVTTVGTTSTSTPIPTTTSTTTPLPPVSSTTIPPTTRSTTPAPTTTSTTTTPAPTTTSTTTTPAPTTTPTTISTMTPTNTPIMTSSTTSSTPSTTTRMTTPSTTTVRDSTITTASMQLTTPLHGHLEVCPKHLKTDIALKGGFIGQYSEFCYELVNWTRGFDGAEAHCKSQSGTLSAITNQGEQNYIERFLSSHNYIQRVWIGLNDKGSEGNLTWTSGVPVSYTNFKNHYNGHSKFDHNNNDCFAIEQGGEWVDLPCGISLSFFNFGEQHPFICQYNVSAKVKSIFDMLPDVISVG